MPKSSVAKQKLVRASWRSSRSPHSLLLQMAADAERAAARGLRIKQLREETFDPKGKKLTQDQLADDIGVTSRAVQLWEAGGGIESENTKALSVYFTKKRGYPITESYIEYGPDGPQGETPDLSARQGEPDPLALLQAIASALEVLLTGQMDANTRRAAIEGLRRAQRQNHGADRPATGA